MSETKPNDRIDAVPLNVERDLTKAFTKGLTKREHFAALALQGVMSNPNDIPHKTPTEDTYTAIARVSVGLADALIAELNKKETP